MGGFLRLQGRLVAVLVVLCSTLLVGCEREVAIPPPRASQDQGDDRALRAQRALDGFVAAVGSGTRADTEKLATSGSQQLLGWVHDNAAALRVGDLALRYVDEASPLTAGEQSSLGAGAWRGRVDLAYRYDGVDRSPARIETDVTFVPTGDAVRIASFGGPGVRSPLWLTERLAVVRTSESLVAVAGSSVGRYAELVPRALRQVRRVLPSWRGPLLVEVPSSRDQLDAVLEAQPGQYDNIAAVTTTVDGSREPGAPVRVFVNPAVFDKLEQRGAQVVMSHEATHVATDAPFASMPTWLLEGFADFVALDGVGVPVGVAAGQILERIRTSGLPDGLPTSRDLDPTASGLGATYEEAWLACRFLAQEHGTDRLVRFYRSVSDGAASQDAFRSQLGTSQRAFVARWRADLARLARVAR